MSPRKRLSGHLPRCRIPLPSGRAHVEWLSRTPVMRGRRSRFHHVVTRERAQGLAEATRGLVAGAPLVAGRVYLVLESVEEAMAARGFWWRQESPMLVERVLNAGLVKPPGVRIGRSGQTCAQRTSPAPDTGLRGCAATTPLLGRRTLAPPEAVWA